MSAAQAITGGGALFLALGMWLLLPGGLFRRSTGRSAGAKQRLLGVLLALIGLGLFASKALPLGAWTADLVFWSLAAITILSAVATVTLRSPVYCAIWFAMSLLGTAGLFFFQGAQFLSVATVVVYAGAILVTFLFVLMLANPEGHAYYDRIGWEPLLSAATGAVLVGLLTMTISSMALKDWAAREPPSDVLMEEHVARLGGELFSRHLIGVEIAGTLLLVALVGAVAIVAHEKQARERSASRRSGGEPS